jgi:ferritin-like protein
MLEITYLSNNKGIVRYIMVGVKQHRLAAKIVHFGTSPPGLKSCFWHISACNYGNLFMPQFPHILGMLRVSTTWSYYELNESS